MAFRPMPAQVSAECDACGSELECDGMHPCFDADSAAGEIAAYDWHVVDGRLLCEECSAGSTG